MPSIFISYRRSDSENITGRIDDHLVNHFTRKNIFKDVDSIPLGVDFQDRLEQALDKCDVFIAVIGKDWLTVLAEDGTRRLDNPSDWVRLEIKTALKKNICVIPVLVKGAEMPKAEALPRGLKKLTRRNAASVRPDPDFRRDMLRLVEQIEAFNPKRTRKAVPKTGKSSSQKKTTSTSKRKVPGSKNIHKSKAKRQNYGSKTVKFNKKGISDLPTGKPVIYKIFTKSKNTNYIGAAKKGEVQITILKHLLEGNKHVPGVTVQIKQMASIREAEKKAAEFVARNSPKYN